MVRYCKSWYANDLYGNKNGMLQERFKFVCFLNSSKDVALIEGYKITMKQVLDNHPELEDAINLILIRIKEDAPNLCPKWKALGIKHKKEGFTKAVRKQFNYEEKENFGDSSENGVKIATRLE